MFRQPLALLGFALVVGCVDAPITAAHVEADGQLLQPAQSAHQVQVERRSHYAASVTAVLTDQAEGELSDRARFGPKTREVHLFLRADGLEEARPVLYRWTLGTRAIETEGVLAPSTAPTLATSLPLRGRVKGHWMLEIFERGTEDTLLLQRAFEVL